MGRDYTQREEKGLENLPGQDFTHSDQWLIELSLEVDAVNGLLYRLPRCHHKTLSAA